MSSMQQEGQQNLLLRRMDASDFALIAPHLQPFRMKQGTILFRPEERVEYGHFFSDGIGSMVAISAEGQRVEAGLMGRDGFAPTGFAMDDDRSPYEGTIQLSVTGHRIAADHLRTALAASLGLRLCLQRFAHTLSVQSGFTALSNAVHPIEERLARWILMCDDRMASGELPLTHEFLSIMLAVRRPSVTTALHVLEGNGLIRAERGLILVRNRAALEVFAGDAYGKPEREYERLLGPLR